MFRTRARLAAFAAVPVVIGALALAGGASAKCQGACTSASSVSFSGAATFVSGNSGPVMVTLRYTCLPPSPGTLQAQLDENGVRGLSPMEQATCDDQQHSITVTIAGAFTPGTASGEAVLTNGDASSLAEDVGQEVTIK